MTRLYELSADECIRFLVQKQAREIDEPEQVEAMAATLHSWAARDSRTVAITPTRITGRRIV